MQPRLEELANAGFNLVMGNLGTSLDFMDYAWNHGIVVLASLGQSMVLDAQEENKKAARQPSQTTSWKIPENLYGEIDFNVTVDSGVEVEEMLEGNNDARCSFYMADLVQDGPVIHSRDLAKDGLWIIGYNAFTGQPARRS